MPATKKKPAKLKIPKAIGACADLLWNTREDRKKLERQVDEMKKQETQIKEHIIKTLPKSEASGVSGKLAKVSVISKSVPQVEDWDKVYKHIKKTGDFDLIQRRLSGPAVQARWDDKKKVPGITTFTSVTVSLGKV